MRHYIFYIIFIFLSGFGLLYSQTPTENYILTQEPTTATKTVDASTPKVQAIQYFDGLGRPKQSIAIGASPSGKDIVTPVEYDGFGRQAKDYLPYPTIQGTGAYVPSALTDVASYYNQAVGTTKALQPDTNPFSEKQLEASPLSRVQKQAAPGASWKLGSGNEIEFDYQTNTNTEVRKFDVTLTADFVPTLVENGTYGAGQLYKTITRDENYTSGTDNTLEEFKDKEGHILLKRTYEGANKLDTYYVYDIYGNLTYVLPPKLSLLSAFSPELLANLAYQYQYDSRNRLVEKQLPGKGREYMVYDKQNRLVATQDSEQRKTNTWLFTKYDAFGRVLMTGTYTNATTRAALQTTVEGFAANNEGLGTALVTRYDNKAFPATAEADLLTVNYYDTYPMGVTVPTVIETQNVINTTTAISTKGLATASWVKTLPATGAGVWIKTVNYYDEKLRTIGTETTNHLGGYTKLYHKLDFRGKPTYSITQHKYNATATELVTKDNFTYDHMERLAKHTQQLNSGTEQLITQNTYDELGQLLNKKVGGVATAAAPLQQVDYQYNIRGWLKQINDPNALGTDLFAFGLNYNTVDNPNNNTVKPLYNGNIAEAKWQTATDNLKRGYGYNYDALNRLKNSYFENLNTNTITNLYNEQGITYDVNGNITYLERTGNNTSVVPIDKLTYRYDAGNKLMAVTDGVTTLPADGFIDGNTTGDDYTYDTNGNLTQDANKKITSITYNFLNLPKVVTFADGNSLSFDYDASGIKLKKTTYTKATNVSKTTDYLGGYQYEAGALQFFPHPEGYVKLDGINYVYVYNYTDQVGDVRLSYADLDKNGSVTKAEIIEESNYYPFGLKHKGYNTAQLAIGKPYKYGFQGQELQDDFGLNWSSFKWRNADISTGRFMSVDPLSETYEWQSVYAFGSNQPVHAKELEGMESEDDKSLNNRSWSLKDLGSGIVDGFTGIAEGAKDQLGIEETYNVGKKLVQGDVEGAFKETSAYKIGKTLYDAGTGDAHAQGVVVSNVIVGVIVHKAAGAKAVATSETAAKTTSTVAATEASEAAAGRASGSSPSKIFDINKALNEVGSEAMKSASTPVGRLGSPINVKSGTNSPATINGIDYSGHALDQMQGRGLVPSVVENAINNPVKVTNGNTPGTKVSYSGEVKVITNQNGKVVTVMPKFKF